MQRGSIVSVQRLNFNKIKKIIITCIALIWFAVSYAQGNNTFTDSDNTFSMDYPVTWESRNENYDGAIVVNFESRKKDIEGRPDARAGLYIAPLRKGQTFDAALKDRIKGLKENFHVSRFIENKKAGGKQILVFNVKVDGVSLKMKMVVWQHNGQIHIYSFKASLKHYAVYQKDADGILNSFKYR